MKSTLKKEVALYVKMLDSTSGDVPHNNPSFLSYLWSKYGRENVEKELEKIFNKQ